MRVLLDSNAYSLLMRGNQRIGQLVGGAEEVLFSVVVIGELMYGFRQGSRFERNMGILRLFLDTPRASLVPEGSARADHYSRIAASLRAKEGLFQQTTYGSPHMRSRQAPILISDDRHFEHVEGIMWTRITAL